MTSVSGAATALAVRLGALRRKPHAGPAGALEVRHAPSRFGRTASRATVTSACALGLLAAVASPSFAATAHHASEHPGYSGRRGHAVFVQTDSPAGNQVVAYERSAAGTLTQTGIYPTGGLGGVLAGSVVDHLASQGSLVLDRTDRTLIAVNAGSNTISVFGVRGDRLWLRQVVSSGGIFPVSIAVHGGLVYVLNALGGGTVQGFAVSRGQLVSLAGSARALGLDPVATPQYTNTPGQVAFSPDGSQLIVTTKANGNDVDVFGVGRDGYLTATPAVNYEPGAVPFAIAFSPAGDVVVAEAGTNALATFALQPSGVLTQLAIVSTGQSATCWVTAIGSLLYASNAGSASESAATVGPAGSLTLLGQTATDGGPVDSAADPGGRFLYVQTGSAGIVDEFAVGHDGALTQLGSVLVPGAAGGEGIAAS